MMLGDPVTGLDTSSRDGGHHLPATALLPTLWTGVSPHRHYPPATAGVTESARPVSIRCENIYLLNNHN